MLQYSLVAVDGGTPKEGEKKKTKVILIESRSPNPAYVSKTESRRRGGVSTHADCTGVGVEDPYILSIDPGGFLYQIITNNTIWCFALYYTYIVLLIFLYHIEGFLNNWIHFDFRIKIKIFCI